SREPKGLTGFSDSDFLLLIIKTSMVMASVGHRMAHSPQRMHFSSSLSIAESGPDKDTPSFSIISSLTSGARSSSSSGTNFRQYSGQISTQRLQSTHFSAS